MEPSKIEKVSTKTLKEYANKYANDGIKLYYNKLMCKLCNCKTNLNKKSNLLSHLKTEKHKFLILKRDIILDHQSKQENLSVVVADCFLKADIPLKKLRSQGIIDLFKFLGFQAPSETTTRRHVDKINKKLDDKIKNFLSNKKLFVMFDGSTKSNIHYFNILAGAIDSPHEYF